MTPTEFTKERKSLQGKVVKMLRPHLKPSGYVRNPTTREPLKLFVFRDGKGELTKKAYKLRGGFVIQEMEGFTQDGVITDGVLYPCGGLSTTAWSCMPIEDLYRLANWLEQWLPKLTHSVAVPAAAR
jgi:hypothetical protein